MKIVINRSFGMFSIPEAFFKKLGITNDDDKWSFEGNLETRTDARLIELVEKEGYEAPDLAVVEIPDESTDWEIGEYDGKEWVIYVLNGKIHRGVIK